MCIRDSANYAILSIDGVCAETGISTLHAEEVMVERMMMERANETIIIAASNKPVSYKHLDVYKRQAPLPSAAQY